MFESKKSSGRLILEVIGLTILALGIVLFISLLFLISLYMLGFDIESISALIGGTIVGQIGFLILGYSYIRFRDITVPIDIPSKSDLKYIIGSTILALITAIGLQTVLAVLDLLPESPIEEIALENPIFLLALAFLSIILVAPAEELLFRGAIQGRLREGFSAYPAIFIASILFGAMHFSNYVGELLPILLVISILTLISIILGWVYEKTDNLAVPIIVHAAYNVVLLVTSYLMIA